MKTKSQLLIAVVAALASHQTLLAAQEARFTNEVGWVWHAEPAPANWEVTTASGLVQRLDDLKPDKLLLTLAHPEEFSRGLVRLRPVAFNADGQRFEFKFESDSGIIGVSMKSFTLPAAVLPRKQIAHIGLEKLTEENLRTVMAPAAFHKLREAGAQALAYPVVGQPLVIDLVTIDGRKLTSRDLLGKVVLLDFWATWCGPCMAKTDSLKKIYARFQSRGFEIIGLNHDQSLAQAKRMIAKDALAWPNVLVPTKPELRELWMAATGTTSLPRLLLLDWEGILRAEVTPAELEGAIEKLVQNP